jgi:hypothetical protein
MIIHGGKIILDAIVHDGLDFATIRNATLGGTFERCLVQMRFEVYCMMRIEGS